MRGLRGIGIGGMTMGGATIVKAPEESLVTTLLVGLECYWKLDEASGAARLDSHGVENLDNVGTVGQVAGKLGNAALFNNNYANKLRLLDNNNIRGGDTDWSFNVWVNLTSKTGVRMIFSKWPTDGASANREFWLFYYNTDDRFHFNVFDGSSTNIGDVIATTFGSPSTSAWYMITVGHSATNNKVWISVNGGAKDIANTTGAAGSGTSPFIVGAGSSSFTYDGAVDSIGYWKKELSSDEITALYNEGNGLEYPFLDGDALYSTVDATDGNGIDIRVLVPGNHSVGTPYPVVLYHHGDGETYTAVTADALKIGVVRNLLGNGYIVAGSSQHGDSMGNDDGTADILGLYNYLNLNYDLSARTINFSQSNGGISGLLCSTSGFPIPYTKGWFGIFPTCDLAWIYANGFDADIDAAYNIPGGGDYATQTAGHDPMLLAATVYAGLRMRFYASAADATVTKVDNTDAMRTLVTGQAAELGLVTCTGAHGDPSHFRPTDVSSFCARCT